MKSEGCCDIEPIIISSRLVLDGDDSPTTKTRAFTVLTMQCINPQCPNFRGTWENKIEMEIGG